MTKKLYLALLCVAAITFTSCGNDVVKGSTVDNIDLETLDNTTEKCWEITASKGKISETTYDWGTERQIVAYLQEAQKIIGSVATYSYKANNAKNEEACLAQDENYEPRSCWKVSYEAYGTSFTMYTWDSEEGAKLTVDSYKKMGWTASYEKASADDEYSCEALNE
ncbi:MAG: hypothetical protein IJS43_01885 [Bacteroidaceae bacterium]|nr:hypothetical protein [Bacteroidaceae bacterium]